jgi:NADH-quinone oxidoreductase subunit J
VIRKEGEVTPFSVIFYVLACLILIATGMAVTRRQPVYAVLYLIVAFLGTAALFYLLGAPLLAAFMVIVYAGAIMVFILFTIMLFQRARSEIRPLSGWGPGILLGGIFLAVLAAMVSKDPGSAMVLRSAVAQPGDFGRFLFDRYWLAIEVVAILFLVALVAVHQLGKRKGEAEEN